MWALCGGVCKVCRWEPATVGGGSEVWQCEVCVCVCVKRAPMIACPKCLCIYVWLLPMAVCA